MSKTFPPVTSVKFRLGCFLALTLVAAPMASSPAFAADDDELIYDRDADPVVLSEMEVYGSQGSAAGYQSRQSLAATKTDTPLVDVPQSITVVTRELIDDQAMRSMGDVVRYMPGVGIAQGEGNRDTPVLRGNSSTASFFLDGIRDDVEYFRDFYNVDRVEALKGPNAMIFGRGGPGGLINRVTKQANQTPVRELAFTVGAWEQYRTTVDFGHPVSDRLSLRVNGLYEDSRSYRDGFTLRRYAANPTLTCQIAPRTTLRAGFEYFHEERIADRGVPSYQGRPLAVAAETFFGDPAQSPTHTTVRAFNAALHHDFGHGLTLRNTTRFADYAKFYQNVFPGAVNAAGTTVAISAYNNDTDRENFFNQTDLVYTTGTGRIEHVILLGLELGLQETDNLRNTGYFTAVSPSTTSVSVPLTSPRYTHPVSFQPSATDASNHGVADTVAVYAQDQLTLLPQLQAVLGARLENFTVDFRNNRTGTTISQRDRLISPRAGLIWKPAPTASVYASYSESSLPRAGEQLASLTLTNRAFDPEIFENIELGVKWDARPELSFSAAVYQLDRRNVVVTDPADVTRSILVDGQSTEGFELGLSGRINTRWSITGGYAYQEGEIKATQSATIQAGARLAQLPRHSASLWNRYDLNATWGFGLGWIYRGEIYASTDNTVSLPGFARVDAAIFCRINDRLRAQLNVENVLDRDYYATAHSNNNLTPGSPLALRLSVTARF
jgi:catecholate siderophore receptor